MSRALARDAEIAGRRNDAAAEEVHPDPVRDDPRRQRMIYDRFRQLETAAAVREGLGLAVCLAQDGRESARDFVAESVGIAADVELHVDGLGLVGERHQVWVFLRRGLAQ